MNKFCFSIGRFLLCKDEPSENKTAPFLDEFKNTSKSYEILNPDYIDQIDVFK